MEQHRHYSRSPITEVILDLKVIVPEETNTDKINSIYDLIKEDFPQKEVLFTSTLSVQAGPAIAVGARQQQIGYLFRSENQKRVFQASLSGFTFNLLAPYDNWESFRDEAKRLWQFYKDACQPVQVIRAGLRYIDRFDLPGTRLELKDYFRTVPEVSPDIPDIALQAYIMQLQIPQPDIGGMVLINEALIPPPNPETVSVILDIDVFCEAAWEGQDDSKIWNSLEELHERAYVIFEASITNNAREVIA